MNTCIQFWRHSFSFRDEEWIRYRRMFLHNAVCPCVAWLLASFWHFSAALLTSAQRRTWAWESAGACAGQVQGTRTNPPSHAKLCYQSARGASASFREGKRDMEEQELNKVGAKTWLEERESWAGGEQRDAQIVLVQKAVWVGAEGRHRKRFTSESIAAWAAE